MPQNLDAADSDAGFGTSGQLVFRSSFLPDRPWTWSFRKHFGLMLIMSFALPQMPVIDIMFFPEKKSNEIAEFKWLSFQEKDKARMSLIQFTSLRFKSPKGSPGK
jgi:hypothetical protein